MAYIEVAVPPLNQALTYQVPETLKGILKTGHIVQIPLGRRKAQGYVISDPQEGSPDLQEGAQVKEVDSLLLSYPAFNERQLTLFKWVASYYVVPLSNVIETAIPPVAPPRYERFLSILDASASASGPLQKEIIKLIAASKTAVDYTHITNRFRGSGQSIKRMVEKGMLHIDEREVLDEHIYHTPLPDWAKTEVDLDENQKTCVDLISKASLPSPSFEPFLLHGITGSGKTEVYIDCIKKILAKGLGALVILPEIALTPQLIDRFRARLGNDIAVLHSGLSKRARWDSWRALLEKRNLVAIGARSAIFAPMPHLGLIVVDEEHDSSFKQSEGLRYNARDLAIVRAKMEACPVVLGSATPSLETYKNAVQKKFKLLSLPARHSSGSDVSIELVDMNMIKAWDMPSKNISPQLQERLAAALANNEQAFILYNRRGFASYLQCEKCDESLKCPNCSVTYTYHQKSHKLICHYCNSQLLPPEFCSSCQQRSSALEKEYAEKIAANPAENSLPIPPLPGKLVERGAGTEKIYEEISNLFPEARLDRLDRDIASDESKYRSILGKVRSGETQILIGTQMIAKGHDLPNVTLVGIADCDVGLHMPDFRAGEKVFQLLTQAAGRAGRGSKQGQVILQTRVPKHASLRKTLDKDFAGFARSDLIIRKELSYPPFARMLRIIASSIDKELPDTTLQELHDEAVLYATKNNLKLRVYGPAPAPLNRIKARWRCHLLLKSNKASTLNLITKHLQDKFARNQKVRVIYDIDPYDMM